MSDRRILVVGGASLDTLAGADTPVAGGAGLYTALAASRSGAAVTLFAPRPEPLPAALREPGGHVHWLGPAIPAEQLARFEIAYRAGQADYVHADFGAEGMLAPSDLPPDLGRFDYVHLVPLGDISRQLAFLQACRERGAARISAGTAIDLIEQRPRQARAMLEQADVFFMNEEEAIRLFGSASAVRSRPGQVIFVTRGAQGATVVLGTTRSAVPGIAAEPVDPTGAGDTFCGASLVALMAGRHPVIAAEQAMPLAAETTEAVGPAALLRRLPLPAPPRDPRAAPNPAAIAGLAALIAALPEVAPFPFTGPDFPEPGHPEALDYFFAAVLQQFGFWSARGRRYHEPLVASIDGAERKGAFYLFRAYRRWLGRQPAVLTPAGQAGLSAAEMRAAMTADDDSQPLPAFGLHLKLARRYGRDMLALGLSPQSILDRANASAEPLDTLFQYLDQLGGYQEDPLRKKSGLLAIVLRQRPEGFLAHGRRDVPAVIDYHVMRACLRIGLVDIADEELTRRLAARQIVPAADEAAIRAAAGDAVAELVRLSGKSMGAVDWFLFQSRQRCPEMSEPQCRLCAIDPVCAHRKALFQPVRRTSFY